MRRDLTRAEWYFDQDGVRHGPVTASDLVERVRGGSLAVGAMVSFDGGASWQSYRDVAEALERPPGPDGDALQPEGLAGEELRYCTMCGKALPASELMGFEGQQVCVDCKPLFLARLRSGAAPDTGLTPFGYGGFWIRFGAKFIDGLILYAVNFVLSAVFTLLLSGAAVAGEGERRVTMAMVGMTCGLALLQMAFAIAYTVYFLSRHGATPGKMVLKLKVVRSDGSPLTVGRSFGRYFGELLSGLTIGVGYIMAGFDDEKRALHDHICDTRVVRVG